MDIEIIRMFEYSKPELEMLSIQETYMICTSGYADWEDLEENDWTQEI